MFLSRCNCGSFDCKTAGRRRGFTLVELIIAATITAMVSLVVSGLVMAVQTAWQHTTRMQESDIQARAAIDRIKFMVVQAGVYQLDGQPTRLGLGVAHQAKDTNPDMLVVWSGGRNGGMAEQGVLDRLPRVNELVIYTFDPVIPNDLVEFTIPDDESEINFDDTAFVELMQELIESADAEPVRLCDSLRHTQVLRDLAHVRFELTETPSSDDLTTATPGTTEWNDLMWSQGIVSGLSGMRQANVRIEFEIQPGWSESNATPATSNAIPFFGSASYRYVYRP